MSRLEEIKNEYAIKRGYQDFNEMYIDSNFKETNHYIGVIMQMYAEECIKASLEKASESATYEYDQKHDWFALNKESITKPENIILL